MDLQLEESSPVTAAVSPAPSRVTANPIEPAEPALLRIRPPRGWGSIPLGEIWRFRELLLTLAARDIKIRYKQTALGVIWVVLQPLLAAGIFSFVFGRVAKLSTDGVPYFLFSYCGMLAWNAFSTTLSKSSVCLIGNSQLISKVYFPRMVLPLSTVPSSLIDFAVAFVLLGILMPAYHWPVGWGIVLLPVWLALILMMSVGAGLITSALTVSYRDVQYILPVITQFLLLASPIAYSISNISGKLLRFYRLNPLTALLEAFRWSLLGPQGGSLDAALLGYSAAVSVGLFLLGMVWFTRMERRFADVI